MHKLSSFFSFQMINLIFLCFFVFCSRMLERLEGSEDSHWSVNSPNIYDALSAMYAPQSADTPGHAPHPLSMIPMCISNSPLAPNSTPNCASTTAFSSSPKRPPQPIYTIPSVTLTPSRIDHDEENEKENIVYHYLIVIIMILHTASRQFYHILIMRFIEVQSSLGQFLFTQTLLPFLVVLCVAVGCRDIRYPKVELTSKNTGGIGEVCVALGPQYSSTRPRTPISSPDGNAEAGSVPTKKASADLGPKIPNSNVNKIMKNNNDALSDAEASSGLHVYKLFYRLWRVIYRWFLGPPYHNPNDPQLKSSHNNTDSDYDHDMDMGMDSDDEFDPLKGNTSTTHKRKQHGRKHTYVHRSGNLTFGDKEARKQFSGYDNLLALLGREMSSYLSLSHIILCHLILLYCIASLHSEFCYILFDSFFHAN